MQAVPPGVPLVTRVGEDVGVAVDPALAVPAHRLEHRRRQPGLQPFQAPRELPTIRRRTFLVQMPVYYQPFRCSARKSVLPNSTAAPALPRTITCRSPS